MVWHLSNLERYVALCILKNFVTSPHTPSLSFSPLPSLPLTPLEPPEESNEFILFTNRVGIRRVSLDVPELVSVPLPVYNLSVAAGLAWDLDINSLFWADKLIYVANINVSGHRIPSL